MKLDIIIINAGLLIMVITPYFLFIRMASREAVKLRSDFFKIVKTYSLNPDWLHTWNLNRVGIDHNKLKLLVVRKLDKTVHQLIDLRRICKSSVITIYKPIKIDGRKEEFLQILKLQLETITGEIEEIELFNTDKNFSQDLELKNAQKLNDMICKLVAGKPRFVSAA